MSLDKEKYIYFPFSRNTAESIYDEWTRDEKGFLLELLIKYAFDIGEPEEPKDRAIKAVYRSAIKDIDLSFERFVESGLKGRYGAYCKNCRNNNKEPLDYEEWREIQRDN